MIEREVEERYNFIRRCFRVKGVRWLRGDLWISADEAELLKTCLENVESPGSADSRVENRFAGEGLYRGRKKERQRGSEGRPEDGSGKADCRMCTFRPLRRGGSGRG